MKRISALLLVLTIVLAGCSRTKEFAIPEGVHTVKGILQPIDFSLKRRGTHALIALDGTLISYAESRDVNLRTLEGKEVTLTGTFEKNSDPTLEPVLIVQKVEGVVDEDVRPWIIPALGLSLDLPKSYKGVIRGKVAEFTASGGSLPLLSITLKGIVNPSSAALYGPLPTPSSAEVFVVGLRKATAKMGTEKRSWVVTIDGKSAVDMDQTLFTFSLRPDMSAELQLTTFRKILRSVEFHGSTASSQAVVKSSVPSFPMSAGGSRAGGDGSPCGGTAGILCPLGYFCKITDAASESGVCVKR